MSFDYDNLSGRPPGRFVTAAGRLLPGVRQVQQQIGPYAAAWRQANAEAMAASGPLWVALGDSLTQGVGASAFDRGWVGQLAGELTGQGQRLRVLNLSVSGARVGDLVARQLPVLRQLEPALVTVLIGSNDLFQPRLRRSLPAAFETMLARLPAGAVVANLPNPNSAAEAVNRLLHRAVADRGVVLADMRGSRTTSWQGKLAADYFHPNDRGHASIAQVFAEAIGLSAALD
ncbi:MAG TPA: SGNH/GDSL hydrolase family protein [Jatrophihabitans sp.]|nr:SGNH/GDSL hydrolase family protein [Jatrophihabitans sp.]